MAWWVLQSLVTTAVLAGIVALFCRFGRLGPVARHALWAIVLLKLVMPPLVAWPWALPDPLGVSSENSWSRAGVVVQPSPQSEADAAPHLDALSSDLASVEWAPTESGAPAAPAATMFWTWLLLVWGVGSFCRLLLEGYRLKRLARLTRGAEPATVELQSRVASLATALSVATPRIVSVTGLAAPAVWGGFKPVLLWPSHLDEAEADHAASLRTDGLLVHELAHAKRRDHLMAWIELGAGVVWWWNPLFWYVRAELREQAELACDAWVVSTLPEGRRAYAESLLALSAASLPVETSSLAVVGVRAASRRTLERRLVMIMKGRSSLRLPAAGLCGLALVAVAAMPVWAAVQLPPPGPPAPPLPPTPPAVIVEMPALPPPAPPAPAAVIAPLPDVPDAPLAQIAVPVAPPAPAPPRMQELPRVRDQRDVRPVIVPPQPRSVVRQMAPRSSARLTSEGQDLVAAFEGETNAIREEAERKITERRTAAIAALQALQEKLTAEGRLDEAVAIRDYLRAGGPGGTLRPVVTGRVR